LSLGLAVMLQLCCNDTCAESDPATSNYDACYWVSVQEERARLSSPVQAALWLIMRSQQEATIEWMERMSYLKNSVASVWAAAIWDAWGNHTCRLVQRNSNI